MSATGKEHIPEKDIDIKFGNCPVDWKEGMWVFKYGKNGSQVYRHELTEKQFDALAVIAKPIMETIPELSEIVIKKPERFSK